MAHIYVLSEGKIMLGHMLWQVTQVVLLLKKKKKKNLPVNAEGVNDVVSNSGFGRSPGEGNGNPLRYSCLENPSNRGACWTTAHEVTRIRHNLETKSPTTI